MRKSRSGPAELGREDSNLQLRDPTALPGKHDANKDNDLAHGGPAATDPKTRNTDPQTVTPV